MNLGNDIQFIRDYNAICQDFQGNVRTILNVYSGVIKTLNDLIQNYLQQRHLSRTNTTTNFSTSSSRTPLFGTRSFSHNEIEPTFMYTYSPYFQRNYRNNRNTRRHTRTNTYNTQLPYTNRNVFSYDNLEPVEVRPSPIQILSAVESITYDPSLMLQESDPIDQTDFVDGESIIRIRDCGHIFRPANFDTWFSSNVRCPLCRLDIRESYTNTTYNVNQTNNTDNNSNSNSNTIHERNNIENENNSRQSMDTETDVNHIESRSTNEVHTDSNDTNDYNTNLNDNERQLMENLITYANTLIGELDI